MFIKGTIDEYRRMLNTSVGGDYVNGTTTKVKKIIKDVAASERGCDCSCTSPKDIPKEDNKDESLKHQTQIKAMMLTMMENISKSIVEQRQPLIPPKQQILSCEEHAGDHHTSYFKEEVAKAAKFMKK